MPRLPSFATQLQPVPSHSWHGFATWFATRGRRHPASVGCTQADTSDSVGSALADVAAQRAGVRKT